MTTVLFSNSRSYDNFQSQYTAIGPRVAREGAIHRRAWIDDPMQLRELPRTLQHWPGKFPFFPTRMPAIRIGLPAGFFSIRSSTHVIRILCFVIE